jgi:hypothetical protein
MLKIKNFLSKNHDIKNFINFVYKTMSKLTSENHYEFIKS